MAILNYLLHNLPAIVVAALGIFGTLWGIRRTGSNSDKALARTIEAEREGRILERRLELYADLLTYVAQRRQNRDVTMTLIKVNGMKALDQFAPEDIFRLVGHAQALAESSVLSAFVASNEAADATIKSWNILQISQGDPEWAVRTEKVFAHKEAANVGDAALESAIRAALHQEVAFPEKA